MSKNNYKVYVHIAPNGKRYYGITKQEVEKRWNSGYGYKFWIDKKGRRHGNKHFTNAINKYGWDNFEHIVIARGLTEEEAKWLEVELIREWNTTNREYGYNISLGGESFNGYKMTEEHRKKISEALKGKTMSEESKKKMSESRKGKPSPRKGKTLSEETKRKLSEANTGKTLSEETRKKISETNTGHEVTEEHRKKISEALKGKNNPMYGKTPWNKGKTHTEETKRKLSEAHKGKNNYWYGKKGENHPMYGKNHSEESRKKISETMKGRTFSEEHKKHLSESRKGKTLSEEHRKHLSEAHKGKYKGKNSPSAKRIYCVELDKYFDSIVEASEILGCNRSSISMVLRGKRKKAGGYHWLYAEDVEKIEIENKEVS